MSNKHHTPGDSMAQAAINGQKSYSKKEVRKTIGQALAQIDGLLAVDGGFWSNLAGKLVNTDKFIRGVKLVFGKEQVRVNLNVIAEYQKNVPDLYNEIKRTVTKEVTSLTGRQVVDVNLNVIEIKTQEKQDADSVSLQDHVTHFAEATGEFASDTLGKAKNGIGSGLAAVTEKVGQGVEAAKDAISGGAEQAKDAAEDTVDQAKDAAEETADQAKAAAHVAEETAEDLAEAGQEATENAKELAQEAKDAAQEDAQAVQERAEDHAEASQEVAEEAVSSSSEEANSNQA